MKREVKKQENKQRQTKVASQKIKIEFPDNRNMYFYSALALSFIVTFVMYVLTLAPNISFEDSGELVTAAYSLGVPHEPGYPLFTIIGKIFTLIIPFGSIAYRVNLASAFFTSVACLFVTWATVLLIEDTFKELRNENGEWRIIKYVIGFGSGLFFGFSLETWRQAVMTEVYGINSCFLALFILLVLLWRRQQTIEGRRKYLYIISFIIAICITNHTTSLMLIPIFGVFLLVVDFKLLLHFKTILKSSLFFILGLTPYLYLPLASLRNPLMNWGKPDNIVNFFRVITRSQYSRTGESQTMESFIEQLKFYLSHLVISQWYPLLLIFAFVGIIIIYKFNRKYFWFALMFIIMSMPVMTYSTNFDITGNSEASIANAEMVAVFYIPSYMLLSLLMGIGFSYLVFILTDHNYLEKSVYYLQFVIVVLFLFMACSSAYRNYKEADMSQYYYPQKYFNNISKVAGKGSIIMGDLDYYTFPFFYYQQVENKRKDLIPLDINLLKRSWYIEWLQRYYPETMNSSQNEVNSFLKAVAPFESGDVYNGNEIQTCYENMIYSFINNNLRNGRDVYVTYISKDSQHILSKYAMEPVYAAFKIVGSRELGVGRREHEKISHVKYSDFDLEDFIVPLNSSDQILNKFDQYYGDIILSRANMFYKANDKQNALSDYSSALPFFKNDINFQNYINNAIEHLKVQN